MVNSFSPSSTRTDFDRHFLSETDQTGLPYYNTTSDFLADHSLLAKLIAYRSASTISTDTSTTAATDTSTTAATDTSTTAATDSPTTQAQVNPDGTYTVAGWTWNSINAVTAGSIISGESTISTFASGFLENESQQLTKQTVGNLLLNQSNGSLTLGDSRNRSEIELTWDGKALLNSPGNDFVVYENGDIGAPEGYAVAVRIAGSDTFTPFRYEFYDTFGSQLTGNPQAGVLATAFDLSDFGLAEGQFIDAIQIINLQPDDLVDGAGQGFLGTSGVSPLDPTTGQPFALDKLDPDITFVAGLHDIQALQPSIMNIVGTGDFNGDGQTDILLRNQQTGENLVWLMNGTQLESTVSLVPVKDPNWDIRATGDFNGDGKVDIVWRNQQTGENLVWLMNGTTLVESIDIEPLDDLNWNIAGTGDFNNDGQTDLLWRNQTTGANVFWLMNGTTSIFYNYTNPVSDPNWYIEGTGDFNGDGQTDLVWRNQSTGENGLWLMNGIYIAQGTLSINPLDDPNWEIRCTGDLNGDGLADLIWQNDITGENVVWQMNGTVVEQTYSIA